MDTTKSVKPALSLQTAPYAQKTLAKSVRKALDYMKGNVSHAVTFLIASNAPLRKNVIYAIIMLQILTQTENVLNAEPNWVGNQMAKEDVSAMTSSTPWTETNA